MKPDQLINDISLKLKTAENHFSDELKKIRTGRAHPDMLDAVIVKVYGTTMPLKQLSSIMAPEPQLLQITPFDPANLSAISEAIRNNQALGLNPSDDGRVVRILIPPLNTERRQAIVKQLNEKIEAALIVTRNIRHDMLAMAKQAKIKKELSEDDYARLDKQIEELMTDTKLTIDRLAKAKQQEIMVV